MTQRLHRIAVVVAFGIYCMAGKVIWQRRHNIKGFLNPFNENPFANTITTEVEISHTTRRGSSQASFRGNDARNQSDYDPYTVNIEVGPQDKDRPSMPAILRMRSLTRIAAVQETNSESWLYARVAFLFFLTILITWVCSHTNLLSGIGIDLSSLGSLKCQPRLLSCSPHQNQLSFKFGLCARLTYAGLLECHCLHHNITDCL